MSLSEEMLRFRAKHGISQKEFAKRCGLTPQTVCNIENGVQEPFKMTEMKIRMEMEKENAET